MQKRQLREEASTAGQNTAQVETFAARLGSAMERKRFRQVDVIRASERAGVRIGKSQLSQYLSGRTLPRENVRKVLAEILDCEEAWLMGEAAPAQKDESAAGAAAPAQKDESAAGAAAPEQKDESAAGAAAPAQKDESAAGAAAPEQKDESAAGTDAAECGRRTGAEQEKNSARQEEQKNTMEQTRKGRRTFGKSHKLDNVLYDVRGPVVDEANRMEAEGIQVLKLNIGNPAPFGFRTPDEVIHDMSRQLTQTEGYSNSKGLFSARKAIMQYGQLKNLPNLSIDDIYTGNGVSELIQLSMNALLDDGDEVLIPAPDYPLWTACVNLAGGTAVHYICDESAEWYPDIDDMRKKITDRTKAIVIINPNNPTGAVYPVEVLQQIVDIAREHQLMIFSDEIYDRLVMDGVTHTSIASLAPDLFCVTFSGLSKSHMIAGYRIGWMILSGNKKIAKDYIMGLNMLSNMRLCSNVPAQSIVQTALGGYQSVNTYIVPGGRIYEQREYIYKALNDIPGITAVKPKAAFYIFPKIDTEMYGITDDEEFALDLLHEKKILITRGGGFNWPKPDHFRIVYLPRIGTLREAMGKLADFLESYRQ